MKWLICVSAVSLCCVFACACKDGHESVLKEQEQSEQKVKAAQDGVNAQVVESEKDVEDARTQGDAEALEAAKIDATKELANAESEVDEKKLEATKAIEDARRDAGETSGTFQHEQD